MALLNRTDTIRLSSIFALALAVGTVFYMTRNGAPSVEYSAGHAESLSATLVANPGPKLFTGQQTMELTVAVTSKVFGIVQYDFDCGNGGNGTVSGGLPTTTFTCSYAPGRSYIARVTVMNGTVSTTTSTIITLP